MDTFLGCVAAEVKRAQSKHPALHSLHEAYAVILEEMDELKAEIWKQREARSLQVLVVELIQIAAMCARTVEDLGLLAQARKEAVSHVHTLIEQQMKCQCPERVSLLRALSQEQEIVSSLRYGMLMTDDIYSMVNERIVSARERAPSE